MSAWEPCVGASDEWYTPRYIFDALGVRFDLDVAAPVDGPRHVPCDGWCYSPGCDGLAYNWFGFVWMNPPFGARNGLEPWLDKFIGHGSGVALVPDRTSAPWFQNAAKRVGSILFLSPKVKFERPDGRSASLLGQGRLSSRWASKASAPYQTPQASGSYVDTRPQIRYRPMCAASGVVEPCPTFWAKVPNVRPTL